MIKSGKNFRYNPVVLDILNVIGISIQSSIILIVQILLVHKPTNIFIVNIIQSYKPNEKDNKGTDNTKKSRKDDWYY